MAKVQVQVVGGTIQPKEARTIGDLKRDLALTNYQASVNGEPKGDSHELTDYEFVALSPQVKGAKRRIYGYEAGI